MRMNEREREEIKKSLNFNWAKIKVRDIVVLYLEGKGETYPMIERKTGIKVNTIKSIIKRHRSKTSPMYLSIVTRFLTNVEKVVDPEKQDEYEKVHGVFS